jgi:hypothetical protein
MSTANHRLAARYRLLLLCYPREYRRQRGREIVDTLLELAPSGQTRPTIRQAFNLFRNGMRCRLGHPASRSVVVWAVLTSVVWGLFAAAIAERVAWETARPLPNAAQATATFTPLLPGENLGPLGDSPPLFGLDGGIPVGWTDIPKLLFGNGIEYGPNDVVATVTEPAAENRSVDALTRRLQANGWQVDAPWTRRVGDCSPPTCEPARPVTGTMIIARRGDDILTIDIQPEPVTLYVRIERAPPTLTVPAGIAAGLAGAAAVWLLFGWVSRRLERLGIVPRAIVYVVGGWALILWYLPMVIFLPYLSLGMLSAGSTDTESGQLWIWLGQPVGLLPLLIGTALALAVMATAAMARRLPAAPAPVRSSRTWPGRSARQDEDR